MIIDDFLDVLASLARERASYVVTGGAAVVFHGHLRPISDLDLIAGGGRQGAERVHLALANAGFAPTLPLTLDQVVVMTYIDARGRRVDVHTRNAIPFERLATPVMASVEMVPVPFIALEDLIAVIAKTRPQDRDLAALRVLHAQSQRGGDS